MVANVKKKAPYRGSDQTKKEMGGQFRLSPGIWHPWYAAAFL